MNAKQIEALIAAKITCTYLHVDGDGAHWDAVIVSQAFAGKSRIERHKLVYSSLGNNVQNNAIHALSMRVFTPEEYATNARPSK